MLNNQFIKIVAVVIFALNFLQAQDYNKMVNKNAVVMTWNKNTPESEMKDDIESLKKNNDVTIKYSNLKRNSKGEITSLKVEYKDNEGNAGSMEYSGKNAIPQIVFHKTPNSVGFGNDDNQMNIFPGNFNWNDDMNKSFTFNFDDEMKRLPLDSLQNHKFDLRTPQGEQSIKSRSKIMIQKDGRKPLVIEDGEVTQGAEDYTPEEIEEIKKNNQMQFYNGDGGGFNFNFNSQKEFMNDDQMGNLKEQFNRMQEQMNRMRFQIEDQPQMKIEREEKIEKLGKNNSDLEQTQKEMLKAKDEMIKAKEELEKAKKELQKAKSQLKTQRI